MEENGTKAKRNRMSIFEFFHDEIESSVKLGIPGTIILKNLRKKGLRATTAGLYKYISVAGIEKISHDDFPQDQA